MTSRFRTPAREPSILTPFVVLLKFVGQSRGGRADYCPTNLRRRRIWHPTRKLFRAAVATVLDYRAQESFSTGERWRTRERGRESFSEMGVSTRTRRKVSGDARRRSAFRRGRETANDRPERLRSCRLAPPASPLTAFRTCLGFLQPAFFANAVQPLPRREARPFSRIGGMPVPFSRSRSVCTGPFATLSSAACRPPRLAVRAACSPLC